MPELSNPFEGMKRKRLPGMHMMTARAGGVPLRFALAAHFFTLLHDKVKHKCLIEKDLELHKQQVKGASVTAKTSDGAALANVFGMIGSMDLVAEEWSYLDDKDMYLFLLLADGAIEMTQRWIAEGKEKPYELPALGGAIVERAPWTIKHYNDYPDKETVAKARQFIDRMLVEIKTPSTPAA